MRGKLYYTGFNAGWKLAKRYATGTNAQRRAIRARLAKLNDSWSQFANGVWEGFEDFAEQRSEAIKAGLAPRTINPHKFGKMLARLAG
jgi:hypothetical protein